jgi:hypothetical protein
VRESTIDKEKAETTRTIPIAKEGPFVRRKTAKIAIGLD